MTIKAREVREMLQGKADPQIIYCFESIIEQQNVLREQLHDVVAQMDVMADILNNVVNVASGMQMMKDKIEGKEHITDGE